jgi:hypothetical protein
MRRYAPTSILAAVKPTECFEQYDMPGGFAGADYKARSNFNHGIIAPWRSRLVSKLQVVRAMRANPVQDTKI